MVFHWLSELHLLDSFRVVISWELNVHLCSMCPFGKTIVSSFRTVVHKPISILFEGGPGMILAGEQSCSAWCKGSAPVRLLYLG